MPKQKSKVIKEVEVIKLAPVPKVVPYELKASYFVKDREGYKTLNAFESKGDTVGELIQKLDFPKGVVCLVIVTVRHGGNVCERRIAPHKARWILEDKDEVEFNKVFRGV